MLVFAVSLASAGCAEVGGDGEPATRVVPVDDFTALRVHDALTVELTTGAPELRIEGERGLVEHVRVARRGPALELSVRDDELLGVALPMRVLVRASAVSSVEVREASVVTLLDAAVPALALHVWDGSALRATGRVPALTLRVGSAAEVDAGGLQAEVVDVEGGGGAATASVFASSAVRGRLTDHAELSVRGGGAVEGVELTHDAVLRRAP